MEKANFDFAPALATFYFAQSLTNTLRKMLDIVRSKSLHEEINSSPTEIKTITKIWLSFALFVFCVTSELFEPLRDGIMHTMKQKYRNYKFFTGQRFFPFHFRWILQLDHSKNWQRFKIPGEYKVSLNFSLRLLPCFRHSCSHDNIYVV